MDISLRIGTHRKQEAGNPARGIAARLLQNPEEHGANYREQYWGLGSFFLAGSDTQSISSEILLYVDQVRCHFDVYL